MENFENFKENVKENFKNWFRKLKETLEFHRDLDDFDEQLKKIPTSQNIDDYYYDVAKNDWVPKSQMGDPLERIDTNINNLVSIQNNKDIGETYEIELPIGKEVKTNLPVSSRYINTIILDAEFVNYTGYDKIKVFYYIFTPSTLTSGMPAEVMENYILRIHEKRAVQLNHFIPLKDFQIGFINNSSRIVKIKYTLLFSEQSQEDNYLFDCQVNNEILPFAVFNPINKFNKVSLILYDNSLTINADIDISVGFGYSSAPSYKVVDLTITSGTNYSNTFDLPSCSYFICYIKNNKSSNLDFHMNLFFSNSKEDNEGPRWIICLLEGASTFADIGVLDSYSHKNANNPVFMFGIPKEYINEKGKNLILTRLKIGVWDADANNYIDSIRIVGWTDYQTYSYLATYNTNIITPSEVIWDFSDIIVGGNYERIAIRIETYVTAGIGGALDISYIQMEFHYE